MLAPVLDPPGLVRGVGQGLGRQDDDARRDGGDRFQVAGEAGGEFGVVRRSNGAAFDFDGQPVEMVLALDDQLVFAGQRVVLTGDGLDVAGEATPLTISMSSSRP